MHSAILHKHHVTGHANSVLESKGGNVPSAVVNGKQELCEQPRDSLRLFCVVTWPAG